MGYRSPVDEVVFGRYRLIAVIGEGGMGKVYRAHDTLMDREVAIKVLPTELSAEAGYQERFRREAHTAARLTEPHIIPIYETGDIEGQLYLTMPVIAGTDLHTLLQREGPMRPQRAVKVIEQLASALGAAHAAGLVHRDVKPSNALVTASEFVYLIDFGIAHDAAASRLTQTGSIVGTWGYMAPERFTTGTADARADVYALACVLYECVTGRLPYPGDSLEQQIAGHLSRDIPRPSAVNPAIPAGLDEVIATGMAKDPGKRYATTIELADAARDAITVPTQRPTLRPAPHRPPPEPPAPLVSTPAVAYEQRPQPPPSPWAPAAAQLRPESLAYYAPQFGSPAPQDQRTLSPMPLSPGAPTPTRVGGVSRRTTIALVAGVIALVVVLVSAGITSYLLSQPSTVSQPSTTSTTTAPTPTTAPPVAEGALEGLLLSPDQINTAIGATNMTITGPKHPTSTYDDSATVPDKACLPLVSVAQDAAYAGSRWSSMHSQALHPPGPDSSTPLDEQAVVLFSSANDAEAFFTASAQRWPACANRQYHTTVAGKPDAVWTVGPVSNINGTLSVTKTAGGGDSSWTWNWRSCQRALTVANNVAIDVEACSENRSDAQSSAAVNIARQMAAKVST